MKQSPYDYLSEGRQHFEKGEYNSAIQFYNQFLDRAPQSDSESRYNALTSLALCYEVTHKLEKAEEALTLAASLQPDEKARKTTTRRLERIVSMKPKEE